MSDSGWSVVGSDDSHRYSTTTLSVFWPESEYHALIARWPHLADHLGATWDEHRQRTERHCALTERAGLGVQQLPGDVPGFVVFLAGKAPCEDDLHAYPDLRDTHAPMTSWPPARSSSCWCGSGRRYKQCCRRFGLGTLD